MNNNTLPYVWTAAGSPTTDLSELLAAQQKDIDGILLEHGAILFKGFAIDTLEKFQHCSNRLPKGNASYIDGNSPRTKLSSSVYTSTEYPAELEISLHNELSYSHAWPARLYFCCIVPAQSGGSTTIADSRALLNAISPTTRRLFETRGVKYVRNLPGNAGESFGKTWQDTFETGDRSVVEDYCRAGAIEHEWKSDGSLRLLQTRPAIAEHPQTGAKVWFNQVDQFHPSTNPPDVYEAILEIYGDAPFDMPQYGCFGDDSPIPDDILAEVRAAAKQLTVAFTWERGDLMVIDNMLTAHGRSPFTGPRKILVTMSN